MAAHGQFELPGQNAALFEAGNPPSNQDWSHDLKRLFAEPNAAFSNQDWSHALKCLFAEPKLDLSDEDWGVAFTRLFLELKPIQELDIEAIAAAHLFGNNAYEDYYYEEEGEYYDQEWEYDDIPCYRVHPCKGAKKAQVFRAKGRKYTRRHKNEFSIRRAEKQVKKIMRGGVFDSRPITHGSYGAFGFEI